MMYNISTKKEEKKPFVNGFTSKRTNKMKREVIEKITDVENAALNDLYFMAEMHGLTIHQFLEHVDGRNFVLRKNGDDTTLIRRKYYKDIKSYGEYSSVGFEACM